MGKTAKSKSGIATTPLRYQRHGDGPPLVFLHGLGAQRTQAEDVSAAVRGWEQITIDLPGHGDSAHIRAENTFAASAAAVLELLESLEVHRFAIGGISMGAGIALRVALDAPDRVMGLILVRPAWTDRPGRPHIDLVADIGQWARIHGLAGAQVFLHSDPRFQAISRRHPLAAASISSAMRRLCENERWDVFEDFVDAHPIESLDELALITQPTLVVSTEMDDLHPTEIARTLSQALPNATLVSSPPRYEEPEAHQIFLSATITDFLSDPKIDSSDQANNAHD